MEKEIPFYVRLAEALEQARKEGSAVLQWADVKIEFVRIEDDRRTSHS